jgi:hypothetical protein
MKLQRFRQKFAHLLGTTYIQKIGTTRDIEIKLVYIIIYHTCRTSFALKIMLYALRSLESTEPY